MSKLYNNHTDTIGNYKTITSTDTVYIVDKLSEIELNNLGYYQIVSESPQDRRYYINTQVKALILNKYTISYTAVEKALLDIQSRMLDDLRSAYEEKSIRPIVDTGLGYNVFGGQLDVIELQDAKNNAETIIIDADNNEQNVDGVAYTAIADAVKLDRTTLRLTGKAKVSEVNALTTVDECITYEHQPYDYTITQEDIDNCHECEYILGEIIVKYTNNITDW